MFGTIRLLYILAVGICLGGCGREYPSSPASPAAASQTALQGRSLEPAAVSAAEPITICSFNIQVFGTSKLKKPQVMEILAKLVRRFDIVAIQEVRSLDETVVPRFLEKINAEGAKYDFCLGPRLGRTSSKEQYAVLFNTRRIELERGSVYTVEDPQDLLHREPLVARFRVRDVPAEKAFRFYLVDIHTDPDETASELDALADVFVGVQRNGSGEDDVILLGDLNVDEYHLGRLGQLPGMTHAITGVMTNTRQDKMYDNILFDRRATTEFTGRWGVVDLKKEFQLSESAALEVSDHCPVWAEFTAAEGGAGAVVAAWSRTLGP